MEAVHDDGTVDLGYVSPSDPSRAVDREEHVPLTVLSRAWLILCQTRSKIFDYLY